MRAGLADSGMDSQRQAGLLGRQTWYASPLRSVLLSEGSHSVPEKTCTAQGWQASHLGCQTAVATDELQFVCPMAEDRAWASLPQSLPQCTANGQPWWPINDETPWAAARPMPQSLQVTNPGRSMVAKANTLEEAWRLRTGSGTASLHSPWCMTQHQGHRACLAQSTRPGNQPNKLIW